MGVPPGQTFLHVKVTYNQGRENGCHYSGQHIHKELSHWAILLSENSPHGIFTPKPARSQVNFGDALLNSPSRLYLAGAHPSTSPSALQNAGGLVREKGKKALDPAFQ